MRVSPIRRLLLALLAGYRRWLSPLLGTRCRFHPSCSRYASDALRQHGTLAGLYLALARVLRCQPLCAGGFDPVPERFTFTPWRRPASGNAEHEDHTP